MDSSASTAPPQAMGAHDVGDAAYLSQSLGAAPFSPVPDLWSSQHPADHQYASQSSPPSEYYSGGIAAPANQTESLTYSPGGSWTQPYTVNGQQYEQSLMHYPPQHQNWSQRSLPHHQDNNNWSPQHHPHPHLLMQQQQQQQQHYAPAAGPGGYHSQHFPPNIMYPGYSPSVYGHGSVGGNRHNTNYVSQLSNGDDSIGSGIYHGIVRQHSSNNNNNHRRRSSTKKRIEKEKIITILGCNINPDSGSLISIKGHVVKIAKEQEGSRFIQQRLVVSTSDEVQIVFDEVMPVIDELWNDVYGNFIVQKLLEFGTPDMKDALANRLLTETITLSTKVYGCRVIQKALDELNRADVAKLISTFKDNVLLCLNDHNGNHVIQKAISIMFTLANDAREAGNEDLCYLYLDSINPIIDDIILLIEVLGQHTYGCRAVQRMVEYCIEPQKSKILDSITVCHETLLCHAYGNYVIQKVLEHGRPIDRDAVFHLITKSVNLYSKQKQASNVVEALLRYGNAHHRHEIVEEILHDQCVVDGRNERESVVVSMAKDPFANYVVKTALEAIEEGEQKDKLYTKLLSHQAELVDVPFSKHIVMILNIHNAPQRSNDNTDEVNESVDTAEMEESLRKVSIE